MCKGAALAILIILFFEKKPVGAEYLQRWSGYSDKPVSDALQFLSEPGIDLVTRTGRCAWQLTSYARQMPLMQALDASSGTRNFSESPTTTTTIIEGKGDKVGSSSSSSNTTRNFSECVKLLMAAGIGHPTCDRLAKLPWISIDYINAHVEYARKTNIDTALLIHKMRCQDAAPAKAEKYDYAAGALRAGFKNVKY